MIAARATPRAPLPATAAAIALVLVVGGTSSVSAQAAAGPTAGPTAEEAIAAIEAAQPGAEVGSLGALTIEELLDSLNVPGLSVAVIHDFAIHWAKGYGVRDVTTGEPVDAETIFQAASISKPVAAMGSLKAVQDGRFGLDQDINTILTSWQLDGEGLTERHPVTPRTLMSHVSGLGDAFGFPGYDPSGPIPTVVQILEGESPSNTRPLFMEREPWAAFEYSGGGVTLQQLALSDARGRPFAEVMWSDVLAPLGMMHSFYTQPMPAPREENAAAAHDGSGERSGEARWHVYPEQAAAGLWTTPSDLARFLIEVQRSVRGESNRVLDRAHAREMVTPVGVGSFAVGFGLAKDGEGWYFQHGGSNWGFRGDVVAHTVKGYGAAMLSNADRGSVAIGEIRARIARVYGWDSAAEPVPRGYRPFTERPTIEVPVAELERYVGAYERKEDLPITVDLEDGVLRVAPEGEGVFVLRPVGEATFLMEGANGEMVFDVIDGRVSGFLLRIGGTQRRWVRTAG